MADFTFVHEDPAESESRPRKRQARERAQPKLTTALYTAFVKTLADTGTARASSSTADIDDAILQRIKKCLERANHKSTAEQEAKAAFYLASRLMGQYNVSQAEVLAHEPPSAQQQYAGQSVLSIKRADGSMNMVSNQGFVDELAQAMGKFFDCKSYSMRCAVSMDWTFYGIAQNTITAAMAFEMAYNLIVEWARPYKGISSKASYCLGVAEELHSTAKKEKRTQEKQARKAETDSLRVQVEQEEAQRQAELNRLALLPRDLEPAESNADDRLETESDQEEYSNDDEARPDFDDEEDGVQIDLQADVDAEINRLIKPEPVDSPLLFDQTDSSIPSITLAHSAEAPENQNATSSFAGHIKKEEGDNESPGTLWASSMQLITFRTNASRIADDYIENRGVKLRHSKGRELRIGDYSAYLMGTRDSKKIDVHQKRIEE